MTCQAGATTWQAVATSSQAGRAGEAREARETRQATRLRRRCRPPDSQKAEISVDLKRRYFGPVGIPLGSLVSNEELEDMFAKRLGN